MRRREKNKALKIRLEEWGEWADRPVVGIGYQSHTVEATLMEYGGVFRDGNAAQAIVPRYKAAPRCAEVNRAIQDMGNKDWAKAVDARYRRCVKPDQIKAKTGWGQRKYYEMLNCAHAFLCGRLGYTWEDE